MKKRKDFLNRTILNLFSGLPRGRVLDVGCGRGEYSQALKDLGFETIACDMDLNNFRYHDSIRFQESDFKNPLPFSENSFDYVLFLEIIEHLYNPDFIIRQIKRVLKPGGILILSTPNILNLGSRMRFLFEGNFDFFREPPLDYSKISILTPQNIHIVVWRYQELEYLLFNEGFRIEGIYTDLMKSSLRPLSWVLLPWIRFQSWQKTRRSLKKGGVDYARINKILLSRELLYGRHLIIKAVKS